MNKVLISEWTVKDGNTLTEDKLIRINDNKPEYGSMMVSCQVREFAPGGFTNKRNKVAFIAGSVEDLKEMVKDDNLKAGTDFGKVYGAHKIITVEKLESEVGPRDGFTVKKHGDPDRRDEVLTCGGEVIMRRTYLVPASNEQLVDILIDHDREEDAVAVTDPAVAEFSGAAPKK